MSINSTLAMASQALKAQQLAIQTTGHNLANAATPGYSRQRVNMVSDYPSFEGNVFIGQGVDIGGIQRIHDGFVEAELLSLNANVGFTEAESGALTGVQEAFPLSGGGDAALSAFFGALSDLANNPAGITERVAVIGKARALGDTLAQSRQVLISLQTNLDQDVQNVVQRVNLLTEQVAALNDQITATELRAESANDFRDQRQVLLQELTSLTGATIREEPDGGVTVIASGLLLVGGARFATLDTSGFTLTGARSVTYVGPSGLSFDATALFSQGKIGALLDVRDVQVQSIIDRVDLFAKNLVDEVNAQHALGFDLAGVAGGNFFTPLAVTAGAAANVRVDPTLAANPRSIAAAASATALPGDNRNALALVNLQTKAVIALGGQTLEDNYLSIVGDVGSRAETAQAKLSFQQSLLAQAQARRESVSGVSIDEEMTKLIQFQRAFESSSMLVRTADEMYQSLIAMVR